MMDSKELNRKRVLNKRNELTGDEVTCKSALIIESLIGISEFKKSDIIMCYLDFRNEVQTKSLIDVVINMGKRVVVPFIEIKEGKKEMKGSFVKNINLDLQMSTYGILEPLQNKIINVSPSEIDLVVVPGVVFDEKKNRLGYGAGYYDRFLKNTRNDCKKIAIAFEIQIVNELPVLDHDIRMDMIITENRIII